MKLIKITSKGSLHFKLSDGRLGVCYDRVQYLLNFDNSNCQPIPTVEDRGFNTAYGK